MFWRKTLKKLYWETFTANKNYELLKKKEENNENKITNLMKQMEKIVKENEKTKEDIKIFIEKTKEDIKFFIKRMYEVCEIEEEKGE